MHLLRELVVSGPLDPTRELGGRETGAAESETAGPLAATAIGVE